MKLTISKEKKIGDIQEDFSKLYPFLKIEFYKIPDKDSSLKKQLTNSELLRPMPGTEGLVEIYDTVTVGDLEKSFLEQFGLKAQVSRKAGVIWLETTMTSNWTLRKQNDHGRELTNTTKRRVA